MVDISKMNYEELAALEKQINDKRRSMRNSRKRKEDLIDGIKMRQIINYINERFPLSKYDKDPRLIPFSKNNDICLSDLGADTAVRIHKSIFTLCDLSLNNYAFGKGKNKSRASYPRLGPDIPKELEDEYISMYDEIADIFLKHARKGEV